MYECKVVADSITSGGTGPVRLTTMSITIPRFVLPEFNTHRDFSRNSASSRAIPVKKNIEKVIQNPFIPEAFHKNKKGMQEGEVLEAWDDDKAKMAWLTLRNAAVDTARILEALEVHKHWGNRPLELFNDQTILVTSTRWENFYALRNHPDAAPEMRNAARVMIKAMEESTPTVRGIGDWHLPYVYAEDYNQGCAKDELVKLSCARSARVSALTHEGRRDLLADFGLYERLASSGHMSPLEHAAKVADAGEMLQYAYFMWDFKYDRFVAKKIGNLDVPWLQHRKMIPGEDVFVART